MEACSMPWSTERTASPPSPHPIGLWSHRSALLRSPPFSPTKLQLHGCPLDPHGNGLPALGPNQASAPWGPTESPFHWAPTTSLLCRPHFTCQPGAAMQAHTATAPHAPTMHICHISAPLGPRPAGSPLPHSAVLLDSHSKMPPHSRPTTGGLKTCLRDTDRQNWMLKEKHKNN
jgi:hypothetical protein